MIVCEVRQYPEFQDDATEFGDGYFHQYYYSLSAECYDGALMFGPVEHYRETMERFEVWKTVVSAMGGGYITMYRLWDKYIPEDEYDEYEPDVECVWEVHDDSGDEDMYAMMGDDD